MLLQARNLMRRYGQGATATVAVRNVSFAVAQGEFMAIMGPSGSGKTTLMNLIGLLDRPTSGTLVLAGENVTGLPSNRLAAIRNRQIGFIFQSYNLLARNTALENVELPLVYAGVSARERRGRAAEALARVGLSHRSSHWPAQLSGGEQQRVAIARALVTDPAMILADEPTGAIDSRTGLDIMAIFQALNRAGRTIVMVTHNESIACHASRIIELQDGQLADDSVVPAALDARKALRAAASPPSVHQTSIA